MAKMITLKALQDQINDLKAEIVELSALVDGASGTMADSASSSTPDPAESPGLLVSAIFGACLIGIAVGCLLWRPLRFTR